MIAESRDADLVVVGTPGPRWHRRLASWKHVGRRRPPVEEAGGRRPRTELTTARGRRAPGWPSPATRRGAAAIPK